MFAAKCFLFFFPRQSGLAADNDDVNVVMAASVFALLRIFSSPYDKKKKKKSR